MTRIAIICDRNKFSAKIQAFGRRLLKKPMHPALPYHVAWVTDDAIYDMHWKFRKVERDHYKSRDVRIFDSPVPVSVEYLESLVGKRSYGVLDVLLYLWLVPIGFNAPGVHCAEAINDDLNLHSYRTPWIPYGAPPDPHAMLFWLDDVAAGRGDKWQPWAN